MTAPRTRAAITAFRYEPVTHDTRETSGVLAAAHATLDTSLDLIRAGEIAAGVDALAFGLRRAYDALPLEAWRAFADDVCADHPVSDALREDPFVYRAYAKLRGYPGDAGILDLIYGVEALPAGTSALGAALHAHDVQSPACRSVRERRALLVDAIDAAAERRPGTARVLSVACGHLREAQVSGAVLDGAVEAFHAVDQDPVSVALLRREHGPLGVTPHEASVKDLLVGRLSFDGLTLAYAAGLYDYLPTPVAARLTARLFAKLAPGGRVLVANFCPEVRDAATMDAVMAWRLIYRDEAEMREIAAAGPGGEIARQRIYRDSAGNVVYLEIERS
jgi:hypothetical protein